MHILSKFIAPWALAREQFPLHLIWDSRTDFDGVELLIPEDLEVKEILNVGGYSTDATKVSFRKDDMHTSNYFTAILSAKKPYVEVIVNRPIEIRFLKGQTVSYSTKLVARIVRPAIRIVSLNPSITIKDGVDLSKLLKVKISHSGLGKTEVKIDVQAHGNIISEPDTLYYQVVKEIIDELATGVEVVEGQDIDKQVPDVVFDPVRLQEEALDFMNRLEQGELAPGAKAEAIEKVKELLKDETFKKKLLNIMYSKIMKIYLSYIVYFFDRYPHEDVEMPLGKMKVNLAAHIERMTIKISYFDSQSNQYEPIEGTVMIEDQRRSKDHFELPLNIEWESEALKINAMEVRESL